GVELALGRRELLLREPARFGGVGSGLVPLVHRGRGSRHPGQGFQILRGDTVLSLVGAQFRFGGGKSVLRQLDADIDDQVGLGERKSNPTKDPSENEAPLPHSNAHNSMMKEPLGSCKWSNRRSVKEWRAGRVERAYRRFGRVPIS